MSKPQSPRPVRPTRRDVIALGAAGIAIAAFGGYAVLNRPQMAGPATAIPREWLLDFLAARAQAAELGRAYLALRPVEADAGALGLMIGAAVARAQGAKAIASAPALHAGLDAAVRTDYAEDRTLRVALWIMSETEARLYALAALQSASR